MSSQRFGPEFKEEAVRQVVERGYSVPDVAARLGVSAPLAIRRAAEFSAVRRPAASPSNPR